MAAFDVTTKPTSLSLKPGATASIMVVVSNRLGRPVMGSVEGVMTPATAAGWLVPPPNAQRPYPADPSATVTHEFKIAVPEDAKEQVAYFKASARDVLLPDDTRSDGQSVAITVTPDAAPPTTGKKKLPWWIWLIIAVVVLGAAVAIWLATRPDKEPAAVPVPSVLGKPQAEAIALLTGAGFDSVFVKDTVGGEIKDTQTVIRQEPAAESEMPKAVEGEQLLAGIVVSRPPGKVPIVVAKTQAEAVSILTAAGFAPIDIKDTIIRVNSKTGTGTRISLFVVGIGQVAKQQPAPGTELPRGEMVGKTPATIWIKRAPPVIPSVVGKTPPEASTALTTAGFKPITIENTIDDNAAINVVVRQQPPAGGEQPYGTMFGKTPATIVVSRAPTLVPEVKMMLKADATGKLQNAGLQAGSISADYTSNSFLNKRVASSSPAAGKTVPRGSSVNLKVYVYHPFPSICESKPEACNKP
jgi:beta-lactam-binding protein with PASTA domain